jgi:hypothetical protein
MFFVADGEVKIFEERVSSVIEGALSTMKCNTYPPGRKSVDRVRPQKVRARA